MARSQDKRRAGPFGECAQAGRDNRRGNSIQFRAEFIGEDKLLTRRQSHGKTETILLAGTEIVRLIEDTETIVQTGGAEQLKPLEEAAVDAVDKRSIARQLDLSQIDPVLPTDL